MSRRLTVFGASGPVGRAVVRQALDGGHRAVAVTRHPDAYGPSHPALDVRGGDVTDLEAVEAAVEGADAVVFVIGVPYTRKPVDTYSVGMRTVLRAMADREVERLVCVSSKELARTSRSERWLYRALFGPLLARAGRTVYADMGRMEAAVRASDRRWTIARPAGLFEVDDVSPYRITSGHEPGVTTAIPDLAHALLHAAVDDAHVGEVVEVLTDQDAPAYPRLVLQQALRR